MNLKVFATFAALAANGAMAALPSTELKLTGIKHKSGSKDPNVICADEFGEGSYVFDWDELVTGAYSPDQIREVIPAGPYITVTRGGVSQVSPTQYYFFADYGKNNVNKPSDFGSYAELDGINLGAWTYEEKVLCHAVIKSDTTTYPAVSSGGASGDPHIKTWEGKKFDFHGGCDLILLRNPGFADGLGMTIQIRTKIETWWSYIQSAAVKIGDDILEVQGGKTDGGRYWINGVPGEELETGDEFAISDLPVHFHSPTAMQKSFRIDFGNGNALSIGTFKKFLTVNVKGKTGGTFEGSEGLMGTYPNGLKVARDKKTVMEDPNAFGLEWQVLSSEPMLFHVVEGAQHPTQCAMPTTAAKKRRLGESAITLEDAEFACGRVTDPEDYDTCVFDVLATNDKDIAGAY